MKLLEYLINGERLIRWDYWFAMPHLTAREFSALACLISPDNLAGVTETNSPRYAAERQRLVLRLAQSEGKENLSPMAWVDWLAAKGFSLPTEFKALQNAEPTETRPMTGALSDKGNFDPDLQKMADESAELLKKQGQKPTKLRVANEIKARLLRENNPKKTLDPATIEKRIRTSEWKKALLEKIS
ncbi:MAG TPA: hypothetical protein VFC18_02305 [Burkholderiales bacterium]|nr:hypothetical protein [Burkholderiales bacterium]